MSNQPGTEFDNFEQSADNTYSHPNAGAGGFGSGAPLGYGAGITTSGTNHTVLEDRGSSGQSQDYDSSSYSTGGQQRSGTDLNSYGTSGSRSGDNYDSSRTGGDSYNSSSRSGGDYDSSRSATGGNYDSSRTGGDFDSSSRGGTSSEFLTGSSLPRGTDTQGGSGYDSYSQGNSQSSGQPRAGFEGGHDTSNLHHSNNNNNDSSRYGAAGLGAAGVGAAGYESSKRDNDRSYDNNNSSYGGNNDSSYGGSNNSSGPGATGADNIGNTGNPQVDEKLGAVRDKMDERTDERGFTDVSGGKNLGPFTGKVKNDANNKDSPVVETNFKRSEKDAQGRELDSYGKPYDI